MTYHFHIHDGTRVFCDQEGSPLAAPEAVRREARLIARDLLQDGFRSGQDRCAWRLRVVDAAGTEVADDTLMRAAL